MITDVVDFLTFGPWRALAHLVGMGVAVGGGLVAAGYGVAWWVRVDDPDREETR